MKPVIELNTLVKLELDLAAVELDIKSYLEQVEFYIAEPDSIYISSLQNKRKSLTLEIHKLKANNIHKLGPNQTEEIESKLKEVQQEVKALTKKLNKTINLLEGTKAKLDKERTFRINLHKRLQIYRQEIYRAMLEMLTQTELGSKRKTWIETEILKNSNWGLQQDNNNDIYKS